MVWRCVADSGPGRVTVIDETMTSAINWRILKENTWLSVVTSSSTHLDYVAGKLPETTSKSTSEWHLKKEGF